MPKFGDLGSKFLKIYDRFKTSTFQIRYMRNFVKVRVLILFGPKCPNLGMQNRNLKNESY